MPDFKKLARSWYLYAHPWRPGDNMLDIIRPYLEQSPKIAILGSTPEFRQLIKDSRLSCDVYDQSIEMMNELSVGNTSENQFAKNWFDIKGGEYDVILADLVFGLIPSDKHEKLLQVIGNNLASTGVLIYRDAQRIDTEEHDVHQYLEDMLDEDSQDISMWNKISFELVIGKGMDAEDIYNSIYNFSPSYAANFKNDYQNICPYGNTQYQDIKFPKNTYTVLMNGYYIQESVVVVSKKELYSIY